MSSRARATARAAASRSHEEATVASFRKHPARAADYLNAVLEDGDQEEMLIAMRRIAQTLGGVQRLAELSNLNATTLYRTLSPSGNPELRSMTALLKAMGMRLAVVPMSRGKSRSSR